MVQVKFSDACLSNLLFWQVKCKETPSTFWVKPLQGGSVHCYEKRGDANPDRFQFFRYCRKR